MIFQRTELLIGKENLEKLKNAHIIVFGVGGVGGFVVEGIVRAGVGEITLVDFDTIDITNINRQIIATTDTIGRSKVEVLKDRILSINPKIKVNTYMSCFNLKTKELFFNKDKKYDYIIDAIDLITSKLILIEEAKYYNIPIISCMGTGNKLNPTMLEVSTIEKTSVCPLARVMRIELRKKGIKGVKVVYSKELPSKPQNIENSRMKNRCVGSISFVPSVAGFIIASEVVKDLIK